MPTILDKIVATKRVEIDRAQAAVPEGELRARLKDAPPVRDFFAAVTAEIDPQAPRTRVQLIAEVKKASPSQGVLRQDFDPVAIARTYEQHGAAAISVLTDMEYFQGSLAYLTSIRQAVKIPLLRKDFILSRYQLLEARVAGADAVLLIAECLDDCNLRALHNDALELGLTPLVELYEPANLPRVLEAGARLIGVNNRDLRTFQVDLEHTLRVKREIPAHCAVVGESGIKTAADVALLESAGVDAMLVGESLIRQSDVGAGVDKLLQRAPTKVLGNPT
jgi:indole-3-glycerol phosphate synthase